MHDGHRDRCADRRAEPEAPRSQGVARIGPHRKCCLEWKRGLCNRILDCIIVMDSYIASAAYETSLPADQRCDFVAVSGCLRSDRRRHRQLDVTSNFNLM